jgi:hypothetical protein
LQQHGLSPIEQEWQIFPHHPEFNPADTGRWQGQYGLKSR